MTEKEIDNEIKRINRQIVQAAKTFGTESTLYKHYNFLLFPKSGTGIGQGVILQEGGQAKFMIRENKQGIVQISRSKESIQQIMNITRFQKNLTQLSKTQTVKEEKQKLLELYKQRTGKTPKGKEIGQAITEENKLYNETQNELSGVLQEYYEYAKKNIIAKNKVSALSKGRHSTVADLQNMIKEARRQMREGVLPGEGNQLKGW